SLKHDRDHRDLPSFPTRRSSDLKRVLGATIDPKNKKAQTGPNDNLALLEQRKELFDIAGAIEKDLRDAFPPPPRAITCCGSGRRSEEHTSELQPLAYLVCRLLLE